MSTVSAGAITKLGSLSTEIDGLEARVAGYEPLERSATEAVRNAALADLRQLNGTLDKLQAEKVDSVCTAELHSGRDEAKEARKRLNGRIDALRPRVQAIVARLSTSSLPRTPVAEDPLAAPPPAAGASGAAESTPKKRLSLVSDKWSTPQPRVQRMSTISAKALDTLDSLKREIDVVEAKLVRFDDVAKYGSAAERDAAKGGLRQLDGLLDKLQFEKVDAVCTAELSSGKVEAKDTRRALNARIENLKAHVRLTHTFLEEPAFDDQPPPPPAPPPPVRAVGPLEEVEFTLVEDPYLVKAIRLSS